MLHAFEQDWRSNTVQLDRHPQPVLAAVALPLQGACCVHLCRTTACVWLAADSKADVSAVTTDIVMPDCLVALAACLLSG
jgi:hypothetical protein